MATSTPVVDKVSAAPTAAPAGLSPARLSIVPLLLSVAIGAAIASLGMGGFLYYLAHTGRLTTQAASVVRAKSVAQTPTRLVALDPLLVNLADPGGAAYLRLSLVLRVADASGKKADGAKADSNDEGEVDAVRDTALAVLGRQTSDSLLALDGKERLKSELRRSLAQRNPKLKVTDLFFTDFLVQR